MKVTLNQVKDFEQECIKIYESGVKGFDDQMAEITDMLIRAHKKGQMEDDAWQYFERRCFHPEPTEKPAFI